MKDYRFYPFKDNTNLSEGGGYSVKNLLLPLIQPFVQCFSIREEFSGSSVWMRFFIRDFCW